MLYSLVDLMNLARTKLILGSGYSSYSEVAARWGGTWGRSLPILMAGKDFGDVILEEPGAYLARAKPAWRVRREAYARAARERRDMPRGTIHRKYAMRRDAR